MLGHVCLLSRGETNFARRAASSSVVNIDIGGRGHRVAVGCCNLFTTYRKEAVFCQKSESYGLALCDRCAVLIARAARLASPCQTEVVIEVSFEEHPRHSRRGQGAHPHVALYGWVLEKPRSRCDVLWSIRQGHEAGLS